MSITEACLYDRPEEQSSEKETIKCVGGYPKLSSISSYHTVREKSDHYDLRHAYPCEWIAIEPRALP